MSETPRVRMIAGPNGSGKSTIRDGVLEKLIGTFVNADLIASAVSEGGLDLHGFGVTADDTAWRYHCDRSGLLARAEEASPGIQVVVRGSSVVLAKGAMNAYMATLVADFVRELLIASRLSFSFETVMSSSDKIEVLKRAKAAGYRTYLYYIATEDPEINVSRIRNRVALGGHDVPEEKTRARYIRSLENLLEAIKATDRAYMFDNSGEQSYWFAEITDGRELRFVGDTVPCWFETYVGNRLEPI